MSFHPVNRQTRRGRPSQPNTVAIRTYGRTTSIYVGGDVCAALKVRPGDYVRPLIGAGADLGSFALERVGQKKDGYLLQSQPNTRTCQIGITTHLFMRVEPGTTQRFDVEIIDGRAVCRPQKSVELQVVRG